MENLSKEDIRNIVDSPSLNSAEIVKIIKDELDIEIDPDVSREEMVVEIFNAYQIALATITAKTAEIKLEEEEKKKRNPSQTTKRESKKDRIIAFVREGKYQEHEIRQMLDEEYGWHLLGKTHKTRVSRTMRELKASNNLDKTADGILRYVDNS